MLRLGILLPFLAATLAGLLLLLDRLSDRSDPVAWAGLGFAALACLLFLSAIAAQKRRESEERLRKIARNLPGAIFQYRLPAGGAGCFPYADGAVWEVCGLRPQELEKDDKAFLAALHPADAARLRLSRLESAVRGSVWHSEVRLHHPTKGEIWVELRATPERGGSEDTLWHGFMTDVTRRKQVEVKLQRLATTDALTGLHNRRHFLERGTEELRRSRRYGRPLAVLMLDLDHFKVINDRYGHEAGDAVLRAVAERIAGGLRRDDLAGRLGGEEFAVLLPEATAEKALVLAERLRTAVADTSAGPGLAVTASLGVAVVEAADDSLDAALKRADEALYRAKAAGRNQVVLQAPVPPRAALVSSLPQPISKRGG